MTGLPSLSPGALYYALYSRGDGTFHWAVARAIDARTIDKMHAKNAAGPWIFERIVEEIGAQPSTICVMVEIGQCPLRTVDCLAELLGAIPMAVPDTSREVEKVFTCRVWTTAAGRAMTDAGIIACADVSDLEAEVRALAEAHDPQIVLGVASFKVHVSELSK